MKLKIMMIALALAVMTGLATAQSVVYTIRNVVDPPDLKDALNSDFGAVKAALALKGTNIATVQTRQANPSMTNAIVAITPQAPSAVTPTITLTPETGAVTASGANDLITPTATLTPETGAVTAEGANNLATITATLTLQYSGTLYDSTGAALTNANGTEVSIVTNATCAITPDVPTNAVVIVTVTGGDAVWTNATCAITPDLASNSVVAVTVTGGDAIWTNATCAITPDLASNAVVAVSVTGGDAVWTNATAASSALPLFATNATAAVTAQTEAIKALTNVTVTIQK